MGFLSIAGSVLTGLFGGGAAGKNQDVVTTLAEKILPQTQKEKDAAIIAGEEQDLKDVESARAYVAPDMPTIQYQPGMGIIPFFLMWTLDLINHITDTANHIIRPGFFIYLIGGFMKKWPLPDPDTIDPQLWTVFMIVVTFFFGARTLVKDVPAMLNAIAKMRKK